MLIISPKKSAVLGNEGGGLIVSQFVVMLAFHARSVHKYLVFIVLPLYTMKVGFKTAKMQLKSKP